MKLVEVQAAKEFASTFLNDIFFKMAVNSVLDAVPGFDLVHCCECTNYNTNGCCAGFGWCKQLNKGMTDNQYCSFAERKET